MTANTSRKNGKQSASKNKQQPVQANEPEAAVHIDEQPQIEPTEPPTKSQNTAAYHRLSHSALSCFQHIVKRELLFHALFIGLAAISLVAFVFFFSFLSDSFLMGIFIACFFFAIVLYFVLKLYFQEQKPAELMQLRNEYLSQYKTLGKNDPQTVSDAASTFAKLLDVTKLEYCALPKSLDFIKPSLEKLLFAYHWKDVHLFKELFLRSTVDQKVKQVILAPTDIAAHKELASSYMTLAAHFQMPLDRLNPASKTAQNFWERYQTFARLAIEELLIVKEYAPDDLWTSTKLAECYLSLGMLEQAISEYEAILEENRQNIDALYNLGSLYFKQGLHGKGLKIYEQLTAVAPSKAQELIAIYGSHDTSNFRNV